MKSYDIFISYRRVGGADKARTIKAELELQGFHVFLDFDELKDGVFDQRIIHAIESAPIFMMILTPHALDRCMDEQDWVRREIEYAIAQQKHVVPVNADRSFDGFDAQLPTSIKEGLGLHQFSEVMFGQLFKESVAKMIRDRIRPVLEQNADRSTAAPSGVGALIHLETDVDCRIYRFGKEIAIALQGEDTVIRLTRGKHKLEFVSLQNEADRLSMLYAVPENDFEDLLTIKLLAVQQKREVEERETTVEAESKRFACEEKTIYDDSVDKKRQRANLWSKRFRTILLAVVGCLVLGGVLLIWRPWMPKAGVEWKNQSNVEAVDLGLSVKWATRNVGASSASEYGNYYTWEEACAGWSGNWRLPTEAAFRELIDQCTWTWTSHGGHTGYKVTGKNGNSIFLPAVGWRLEEELYDFRMQGFYWSSTPFEGAMQLVRDERAAYYLQFYSDSCYVHENYGSVGLTVRPVSE